MLTDDILARDAVRHYGRESQIRMATEEMGELLAALNQFRRHRIKVEAVQEKIADVLITATQLAQIFGEHEVGGYIESKQQRLKNNISFETFEYFDKLKDKWRRHTN